MVGSCIQLHLQTSLPQLVGASLKALCQVDSLRAEGLQVRNTFIDVAMPVVSDKAASPQRPRSAPPPGHRRQPSATCNVHEAPHDMQRASSRAASPSPSHYSWASTADSDGPWIRASPTQSTSVGSPAKPAVLAHSPLLVGYGRQFLAGPVAPPSWPPNFVDGDASSRSSQGGEAEGSASDHGSMSMQLPAFVEKKCAFLQLRGYSLLPETEQRLKRRGPRMMLRFYVRGLPFVKRRCWQRSLLLAVTAVLQRHGCAAVLRDDELFAPLKVIGASEIVRVEFVADTSPSGAQMSLDR